MLRLSRASKVRVYTTVPLHLVVSRGHRTAAEDDGYGYHKNDILSSLERYLSSPKPGTLILVRHGESEWNSQRRFTGWVDVDLSDRGRREVEHAAKLLKERGFTIDITYTSVLKRAIRSSWIILKELNQIYRPTVKSWRLNERMYGGLEGLPKPELAVALGEELVQKWRAGLVERPPVMTISHAYWHGDEAKYKRLTPEQIPTTESLQDTIDRTLPLWESQILPDLKAGRNVMIVAHCNSLRGLLKHIDNLDTQQIQKIGIPNGIPIVYKFDSSMRPIEQRKAVSPMTGAYLEKREFIRQALQREEEFANSIGGLTDSSDRPYYSAPAVYSDLNNASLKVLSKAEEQQKMLQLFEDHNLTSNSAQECHGRIALRGIGNIKKSYIKDGVDTRVSIDYGLSQHKKSEPTEKKGRKKIFLSDMKGPVMVMIRHGKTEHNKLGLFTGWEDVQLAKEGRDEALEAGRLMRRHNISFDLVYTSWLSRAIETALLVVNELDLLWVPIVKTWRLNERMYGALTGLSKKMIRQIHGEKQFLQWRRGYDTRPPPISSFSHFYPGNDDRYVNYVSDVSVSLYESLIRSLSVGKLEVHRQFPKTESLKDCMERTIPYFTDVILPRSQQGNNILIASSENAIRGLLMHLCQITPDRIQDVEIPTGLPLVFDWDAKRLKLLDDGSNISPLERYNFGKAPELLFHKEIMKEGETPYEPIILLKDDEDASEF